MLGRPVSHSLSPVLHRAAYAALGLNWSYDAIDCDAAGLPALLAERQDWAGFSCTMPLKRALLDVAEEVRPVALHAGAANTLIPKPGGGWIADNTDVAGIVATLDEGNVVPKSVTVIGAGGTAQATVVALAELGVTTCSLLVRHPARTAEVLETADRAHVDVDVVAFETDPPALDVDLVVSTLPPGAADQFVTASWHAQQTLLDMVYDPWPTPLAAAASAGGAQVLSGGLMLLHQAARQVELMTGRPAPVAAMRAALRAARPNAGL